MYLNNINTVLYFIKLFGHSGSSHQRNEQATLLTLANMPPSEDNNDAIKLIKHTPFHKFMFKLNNLNQTFKADNFYSYHMVLHIFYKSLVL